VPLEVVYEDHALLVLNKPSGLLSVPGKGDDKQDCLSARVQARFADAQVVHRLDMATSGLMLMARGAAMQRALSDAFASRTVEKRYAAIVVGELLMPTTTAPALLPVPHGWAEIDLPIALDWPNRPRRIIDAALGKPSVTRWRVLPGQSQAVHATYTTQEPPSSAETPAGRPAFDRSAPFTRLELAPVTGRSHQLRVHLAALGHPILGDGLYAPPDVQARASRLLLHATGLVFAHPATGQTLCFSSATPF
jgi:tRNA pseudouridine32 synthase / 23S rRNA pseudouridine746 synthase